MTDRAVGDERIEKLHELRIDRSGKPQGAGLSRWLAIGLVLTVLAIAGVWWLRGPAPIPVETAIARAVEAGAPASASVLDATGYVTARRQATVSSEVTGKIREVLIEEGMEVQAGQVLARLDDTTEQAQLDLSLAQLASTRATLAEIQAQLTEAQHNLVRTRELAARQLASQKDLDAAEASAATLAARLGTARENVTVSERTVALQRQQLDELTIRAPFSGIVIAKNAQPGEMISPVSAGGGFTRTGICTIVDMDSLEVEVDVNEAYIQRVSSGQGVTATLDAYPDWKIPAEVIAIIPAADRQKATVRVRIGLLERDPRVLPDMGVKVAFLEDNEPAAAEQPGISILVPASAVTERNGETIVFVARDDTAYRREVSVVAGNGGQTRVLAGLTAGERVILKPPAELEDAAPIAMRP
jgi:RND family efflux transporter MFP subunit